MKKGEIWRGRLPYRSGHVQAGDRPAVIVQDDQVSRAVPTRLVVPFTSSPTAMRFPGTVLVQPDGNHGLTMPSVALVFQLVPLDQRDFLKQLGTIDSASLDQIFVKLDEVTGR